MANQFEPNVRRAREMVGHRSHFDSRPLILLWLFATFLVLTMSLGSIVSAQDEQSALSSEQVRADRKSDLAKPTTWQPLEVQEVNRRVLDWLVQSGEPVNVQVRVGQWLSALDQPVPAEKAADQFGKQPQTSELLAIDRVIGAMAIARPELVELQSALATTRRGIAVPAFGRFLDNSSETSFFRQHVRLYIARWLAQNQLYDESLEHLSQIGVAEVCDPQTLLFYRSLMEHQLLKKAECELTLKQLLEHEAKLPRRFQVLAKLMLADIAPLEADSLDEITRIMNDIRRRTGLSRSGKLVLSQEEEVIKKLDKLIEGLEAQQQQQALVDTTVPSAPMEDSFRVGGKGSGDVTSKRQTDGGDWGDLPPADRAAALAEMAKDMPPHYRAAIEEYFRRLAKEKE